MKNDAQQSATSLPQSPDAEADGRMKKYFIMMSVRVACFVLMVTVTPYSWYTWAFAVGAAVLPYLAVVVANVGSRDPSHRAVSPERALPAATPEPQAPTLPPQVIRIEEARDERGETA